MSKITVTFLFLGETDTRTFETDAPVSEPQQVADAIREEEIKQFGDADAIGELISAEKLANGEFQLKYRVTISLGGIVEVPATAKVS